MYLKFFTPPLDPVYYNPAQNFYQYQEALSTEKEAKEIKEFLIIVLFTMISMALNTFYVLKRINWKLLESNYPLETKFSEETWNTEVEINGYRNSLRIHFYVDMKGLFLKPKWMDQFLYKPIFIPWNKLKIEQSSWRKTVFGKEFGRHKEILIFKTRYDQLLKLRVQKNRIQKDRDRMIIANEIKTIL